MIRRQIDIDLPAPQIAATLLLGRLEVEFCNYAKIINASTDGGKNQPSSIDILFAPPGERYKTLPRHVDDNGGANARRFAVDGIPASAKHVFVRVVVLSHKDNGTAPPLLDSMYKIIHLTAKAIDDLYKAVGLLAMDTDTNQEEEEEEEEKEEEEGEETAKPKEWCGACTPDEYCPAGCYD